MQHLCRHDTLTLNRGRIPYRYDIAQASTPVRMTDRNRPPSDDHGTVGVDPQHDPVRVRARPMAYWEERLTKIVAQQIQNWRDVRGVTAVQLENLTENLGHRVSKSVIANLENDRRESISLAEFLVISAALDIPPILLLAPVGKVSVMEILPGVDISPWEVRGWIHGALAAPYYPQSHENWVQAQSVLSQFEAHRSLVRRFDNVQRRIRTLADDLTQSRKSTPDEIRTLITERIVLITRDMASTVNELIAHRRRMRSQGYLVPELPSELRELIAPFEDPEDTDAQVTQLSERLIDLIATRVIEAYQPGDSPS
jgi:hypothetical protein